MALPSIENLLLSDMTLHWPSSNETQSTIFEEGISTFSTWTSDGNLSEKNSQGSMVSMLPSLEISCRERSLSNCRSETGISIDAIVGEGAQTRLHGDVQRHRAVEDLRCQKPNNGFSSLWYSHCQALADIRREWLRRSSEDEIYSCSPEGSEGIPEAVVEETPKLEIKGFFVHPDILPGFKYVVRNGDTGKYLFDGKPRQLVSIGRGYGKRITFEERQCSCSGRQDKDNYFYSDTSSAGFGLKIAAVENDDQFTARNEHGESVGYLTITDVKTQNEISSKVGSDKEVEKKVAATFDCSLEYFDGQVEDVTLSGTAVLLRRRSNSPARLIKIKDCSSVNEFSEVATLVPGIRKEERVTTVSGADVGGIPTSYTLKGLLPEELPVVGTFIHPAILVGAKYRVRSLATGKYLFQGKALKLQSIGRGYGKRITFESESFISNDNYFYSDTEEEGWGFSVEAVSVEDTFRVINSDTEEILGTAEVQFADIPQIQIPGDVKGESNVSLTITCLFKLKNRADYSTTVYGNALMRKTGKGVKVLEVTDLTFDSLLSDLSAENLRLVPQ